MKKKFKFTMVLFFYIMPVFVKASAGSLVKIGNKYYDNLLDAINAVTPNDTITLIEDVSLKETLEINKVVNINLNGNNITAPERVFSVENGTLNLTGSGTIKETNPNYGAIMIKGSTDSNAKDYSVVNVGENVNLEGWSGIFITHNDNKSYGVNVNFKGKINAVNDTSGGTGAGIYVNGKIKDNNNSPVVTIQDGAKITSTGNGLYIAGYSTFNINEASIEGKESGIGVKSGIINIDGATIKGTGPDETPTDGYNDGIKASGTAIQVESNNGYSGNIELNIDSGTFTSDNSNVLYEYIGKGDNSQVTALDVSGGTFVSNANKDVIRLSDSLKTYHNSFISGGKYSSDPKEYLKPGYTTTLEDDTYVVTKSTMTFVDGDNINDNAKSNTGIIITIIIISVILIVLAYLNRTKILNYIKK